MQSEFPANSTIAQVLPEFYEKYDLKEDGGMDDDTVKIVLYKNICFYLPNIGDRKKAVLKHDIHHIITGYKSDFKGETEIGAWEVSSGCKKYWVAWVLDLAGMITGLPFNLRGVFNAFVTGQRTRNLYDNAIPDEVALSMTIDELREKLGLNADFQKRVTARELLFFVFWVALGGLYMLLYSLFLPFIILYTIHIVCRKRESSNCVVCKNITPKLNG